MVNFLRRYPSKIIGFSAIALIFIIALVFILRYKGRASLPVGTGAGRGFTESSSLYKQANAFVKKGEIPKAVRTLNKLIRSFPDSDETPLAYRLLGEIYGRGNDLLSARGAYRKALYSKPSPSFYNELKNKIELLNIKILFSSTTTSNSQFYEVKPGDSLDKIARRFNTTVELLKKANRLTSDLIKPGARLKVQTKPFSIVIDKSLNSLTLLSAGEVIKVYPVSTGKNNSTPTGKFKIANKLISPPWYSDKGIIQPDNPEYVLGSRWMGINIPGYGIHGTNASETIGYQSTEGCVRMYNKDAEELYAIVPIDAEVTIID